MSILFRPMNNRFHERLQIRGWTKLVASIALLCVPVLAIGLLGRFIVPQGLKWDDLNPTPNSSSANTTDDINKLSFTALSVGHGDCFLLQTPEGENILIDGGPVESVADTVQSLEQLGIFTLDQLWVTHPHWDHIGGIPTILETVSVEKLFINGDSYPSESENKYLQSLTDHGLSGIPLKSGDRVSLRNGYLEVLNPAEPKYSSLDDDACNDNSLSLRVVYAERPIIMLPGDIGADRLGEILASHDLTADIVLTPHHGVGQIDGGTYFDKSRPKVVLVSDSKDEANSLSNELVDIPSSVPVYATGRDGSVTAIWNNTGITITASY